MKNILILCCILINLALSDSKTLWDNNKEWSEKWCKAVSIRNKTLKEKYGKDWYKADVYKTIPKEDLETELIKQ